MSEYKTLRVETFGAVMNVTISNPPINLQDDAMMEDLSSLVGRLEADRNTKVVVFRSDTPGYFIAHLDISPGEHRVLPPLGGPTIHGMLHTRISHLRQVTIGEVRGRVGGGGNELILALDMRYASREQAFLSQFEVILGLHSGAGGTIRLAQLMGRANAFEAALSGFGYDADAAERMGWINRALPDAELTPFVDKLAHRIASFPSSGIATIKSIVDQMTPISSAVLNQDSVALWREMALPETQERVAWWLANGGQKVGPMEDDVPTNLAKYPQKV